MSELVIVSDRNVQVTDEKIDCGPISRMGRALREAGVPHILWGWWAAAYNGRKRPGGLVEFVVEDNAIIDAGEALCRIGYKCGGIKTNYSPAFDLDQRWNAWFIYLSPEAIWGPILLHKKSNVLWWLSSPLPTANPAHELLMYGDKFEEAKYLPQQLTPEEDEAMLLPDDFAVAILKPDVYAEALIKLFCLDLDHPDDVKSHWAKHIYELTVKKPSPLGYISSKLDGKYRPFWDALCRGAPYMDEARELRRLLYERQELPYVAFSPATSPITKPGDNYFR